MAQVEVKDLIDQATYSESLSGIAATRKFLVTGLSEQPAAKLFEAARIPDIPKIGAVHEANPQLFVASIEVMPTSNSSTTSAFVVVTYGSKSVTLTQPGQTTTVEMGATSSQTETQRDAAGKEMTLTSKTLYTDPVTGQQKALQQPGKASISESNPYFRMSRLEKAPFNFDKAADFVGTVNQSTWFNKPARTWKCEAIRAVLQGQNYQVTYEFQYRKRTWDASLLFIDPKTGAPEAGSTISTFKVYQEMEFGQLGII